MTTLEPTSPSTRVTAPSEDITNPPEDTANQRHRGLALLTFLGFAIPIASYFWMIHRYGTNVAYLDQWGDVNLAGRSFNHTLSAGNLWMQHSEQRMVFPNIIMLLFVHLTHFDIVWEEYVSAVLYCVAVALLICTHKQRTPSRSWLAYCPVAFLSLSLVQAQSTLFGFQLAWYVAILMLALTLFLLDRPALTGPLLLVAIVTAVIGSFSTDQGLIIWPVGLLLLYQRRRSARLMIGWCVAAAVALLVYEYHFNSSDAVPSDISGLHLPVQAVHSYFEVIGDVLGIHLRQAGAGSTTAVLIFGICIFMMSLYALATRGLRRDESSGAPVGVALIWFGLIYAVGFAYARTFGGPSSASSSQYTTFTLLILVGCYLALLDVPIRFTGARRAPGRLASLVFVGVLCAVCLQVFFGESNGIRDARTIHARQIEVAGAIADIDEIPDPVLQNAVDGFGISPKLLRSETAMLKSHHLTFFDNPADVSAYEAEGRTEKQEGVFTYVPIPLVRVARPLAGDVLKKVVTLDALLRPGVAARKVEFYLSGTGGSAEDLGSARHTEWGWLLYWDSRKASDGAGHLYAVSFAPGGQITRSAPVAIQIRNGEQAPGR
jgi:hypothetical protein